MSNQENTRMTLGRCRSWLTAVSVAALTLYDMVKAVDKAARIDNVRVLRKDGGRSGSWAR